MRSIPSLKWAAAITIGSGLGLLHWSSTPDSESDSNSDSDSAFFKKPLLSFADWSATASESASAFRKLALPESPKYLFGDAYRRKIFFNYEKRIRLRSPPEKVFEYFASFSSPEGELLMTPEDLMRAVVPVFPPSESNLVRDGYLRGERSPGDLRCDPSDFFMLFDVNNDGHISFKEYIFFVTLLSIPESSFCVAFKMFDIDNNGEIDKEEFKKVMALMRAHHRQGAQHREGLRTGLKFRGSVENGGLVEFFFGKYGKERLQHDKFFQFMRDLHDEILRLEFAHYDYKLRGTISAKDFALSMVASADMSHLGKLLDRVDELNNVPQLSDIRITFEEFKHVAELRRKLEPLSLALFSFGEVNGLLTRKDFQRAASQVCNLSLSDNVVEIIFHVFDTNRDGNLTYDEFVRVLYKRERDITRPVEEGVPGLLSCFRNRSNDFSFSRFLS
ncbi:calcium uptake protein, mitochondrial-like isoform X1 [Corylus avellana]|uniref:calcium uptake protein, mitochondrial-like isoform X1 n=1 Tax=Corylus avellana TaxID=13451 RepID=UPI001E23BA06|nr:calcium uptake protein, mitochondrial-like isoform X1 [Corylus avellana]